MVDRVSAKTGDGRPWRVLIVRIGAMGDVLHAMPAAAALRELHPEWEIRWAIEPRWSALLGENDFGKLPPPGGRGAGMPLVDGWHGVRTREWKERPFSLGTISDVMGLRRELQAARFDVCVDMQGAIRSAMVARMAGAGRLVGMEAPREGPAGWLYGVSVKVTAAHVVEQGCQLLGAAVGEVLRPAKVELPMEVAAEVWCDSLLKRWVAGGRFVVMAPTAGWGAKEWPAERYGAVAAELGKAGFRVLVNALSRGDAVAEAVVRASEGAAAAVPCSVGQLIALVRRASLVMGGDTGPLHLAAALERPVVGIYGPTDPVRTGPFGAGAAFPGRVLRDAASVTDHSRLRGAEAGLLRIAVDEVVGTALEVLGAG